MDKNQKTTAAATAKHEEHKKPYTTIADTIIGGAAKVKQLKGKIPPQNVSSLKVRRRTTIPNKPKVDTIKLTMAGRVNLTYYDKDTREVLKANLNNEYEKLLVAFVDALNEKSITQRELENRVKSYCKSIFVNFGEINIKFINDSIDLRTIPKQFRLRYREAEQMRKDRFTEDLKNKLSQSTQLTLEQAEQYRNEGREVKKPFKGKFTE